LGLFGNNPELVSDLFISEELRQNLFRLKEFTAIQLIQNKLTLEASGREKDADYLHFCFVILNNLADIIESLK